MIQSVLFINSITIYMSIASWTVLIRQNVVYSERFMRISAILYQDAFIPCETRNSLMDNFGENTKSFKNLDRINLILWYRDGISVPFYTVDARSLWDEMMQNEDGDDIGQIDHTILINPTVRHIYSDQRMKFDLSKTTPLLRISNITEMDEAIYRCRVEYTSHRTFSTQIRLDVIGPPISLKITDQEGNQLEGVIGPYNEFENITLICTVFGGNPKPSVIWFRQQSLYEEIIDDSYEAYTLDKTINGTTSTVVNHLYLQRLDRNDYLANYLCRASTRLYYPPLMKSVIIDMNLMPISVKVYMNQYHNASPFRAPLIAGIIAEFGCRADGSKPKANIEWFLDDQRIVVQSITTSTVDYNGNYNNPRSNLNCLGDVDDSGTMTNHDKNSGISVHGELCPIFNNDNVHSVPNDLASSYSCKFLSIIETHKVNSTISIIRFIPSYLDNNRILSCHASNAFITNSFNNKIIDKVSLNIQYGPIVTVGIGLPLNNEINNKNLSFININKNLKNRKEKIVTISEQSSLLELNCHIKANPWIDQVIWFQNDTIIEQTTSLSSMDLSQWTTQIRQLEHQMDTNIVQSALYLTNHNQTLRIENIQRFHSGYYQCKAFNSINDSCSEVIKLNVAYVPECLYKETRFIQFKRNIPLMVDCPVGSEPSTNNTYKWKLFSPWQTKKTTTNEKNNITTKPIHDDDDDDDDDSVIVGDDNDTSGVVIIINNNSILNVLIAVDRYLSSIVSKSSTPNNLDDDQPDGDDEKINNETFQSSFDQHPQPTLLLQCEASNLVGKQKIPCSYLIHIHSGPPQKVKNCTFHLEKEMEEKNDDFNSDDDSDFVEDSKENTTKSNLNEKRRKKVLVACQTGNNGGKRKQSVHLIGLLSNNIWQKFWNDSVSEINSSSSSVQSLIKTIELETENLDNGFVNSNNDNSFSDEAEKIDKILNANIKWNKIVTIDHNDDDGDGETKMVWFQLEQFNMNQSYDMIVYSRNSIGISEPLTFFNIVLRDHDDSDNPNNIEFNNDVKPTKSIKSKNWAYLRFKGLIVISLFLLVIALAVAMIRSFVSTASLNDTLGTHSLETSSNQQKRQQERQQQQQQQKTNQEELIPVAQTRPTTTPTTTSTTTTTSKDANQSEPILLNDVDVGSDEHWNHDTNESGMETYYSAQNDQTSHPKDRIDSLETLNDIIVSIDAAAASSSSTAPTSTITDNTTAATMMMIFENVLSTQRTIIIPIKNGCATLKRFLNRSMRNRSHYGTYDLSQCSYYSPETQQKKLRTTAITTSDDDDDDDDASGNCDDHKKWTTDYQEEWEFSLASSSNNDRDSISISISSSSSSSSNNDIINKRINDDDVNAHQCSSNSRSTELNPGFGKSCKDEKKNEKSCGIGGDSGGRRAGRLENLFNRLCRNTNNTTTTSMIGRPSTMANTEDPNTKAKAKYYKPKKRKNRSKKYVQSSNRYGSSGGQKRSSFRPDYKKNNVELVYAFQKDLY